ncbi:DUF2971 domain-containing protein [Lacipirellula sp.]|uniref:DUF2971 domain-containing protein n=1 Tax=Lacipirellula sp. TaxID=2691419 RepID=UPI003D10B35E
MQVPYNSEERPLPERLWKYRPWNAFTRSLVVDGSLYHATVEELNDPFEFRWRERMPTTIEGQRKYVDAVCDEVMPRQDRKTRKRQREFWMRQLRERVKHYDCGIGLAPLQFALGVLCLSKVPDNISMWSHYAARHSGVCVGISTSKVSRRRFYPVHYTDELPTLEADQYLNRDAKTFVQLSLTKARLWQYEKEWRSINHPGPHDFPGCVEQVIVGCWASTEVEHEVRMAARAAEQSIALFKAVLDETQFALNIVTL